MVCLGFEPGAAGPQEGRRRRNHGAMEATQPPTLLLSVEHSNHGDP